MGKKNNPMDDEEKIVPTEPTAEELEAENKELEVVAEDEIRTKLATDMGIDPDEQEELLNKLVEKEVSNRKKLSSAIGQKRKWREKANKSVTTEPKPKAKETGEVDVEAKVLSILEGERLEDMDVPEELKEEIKKVAKLNGISVKKASQDSYILHRKKELEDAAKADDATISRKNRGVGIKFDPDTIPDFDVSTLEGQKAWKEWKQKAKHQGK